MDGSDYAKILMGDLQLMSGSHMLVGGSDDTATITDSVMRNNFYGTIDKVLYYSAWRCLYNTVWQFLIFFSSRG